MFKQSETHNTKRESAGECFNANVLFGNQ